MGIYLPATNNTPYLDVGEWGSPTNPSANVGRVYCYDEGGVTTFAFRDSAGNVSVINMGSITSEPTGFPNRTDSTLSFVAATRTFTIAPAVTDFDYYYKGNKITVNSADNVVIADTNGIHYVYYNSSGTLVSSTSFWDLETTVPIALVLWNTDMDGGTGVGIIAEERHGIVMDWSTHRHLHLSFGTQYHSGLGISGYTLDTDSDAAVQFGISNGEIQDEDIPITITHSAAPSDPFEQILTDPAEIPVYYRVGASGVWTWDTATTFAFKNTTRVNWNEWTGATWQQTEATDNYHIAYWIVATNSHTEPIISMQGQREDQSLLSARSNNTPGSVDFGSLPFAELRILYRVIVRTKSSYSGTRKARIADVTDYRTTGNSVGTNYVPVYHGSLDGLANDDHGQYALLAGRTGGQILYGSDTASENLTLDSTSNATKGLININSALAFDTSLAAPTHAEGQVYWDSDDHTLALQTDVTDVTLQVGQEILVRVTNTSGVTINNGEAVYVTGAQGSRPTIAKAKADAQSTSEVFGVATEDIAHQANGYVTTHGKVRGLDLSGFSDGDHLYLSDATAGALVNSAPDSPNYVVKVACVLNNGGGTSGQLHVGLDPEQTNTTSFKSLRVHSSVQLDSDPAANEINGTTSFVETTPAVTYSQALHMHTDGTYVLADADSEDTIPCTALAVDTGSGTGKEVLLQGFINNSTWSWTVGAPVYVSATAGGLTQTAPSTTGQVVQPVGYAVSSTTIFFNPTLYWHKVA